MARKPIKRVVTPKDHLEAYIKKNWRCFEIDDFNQLTDVQVASRVEATENIQQMFISEEKLDRIDPVVSADGGWKLQLTPQGMYTRDRLYVYAYVLVPVSRTAREISTKAGLERWPILEALESAMQHHTGSVVSRAESQFAAFRDSKVFGKWFLMPAFQEICDTDVVFNAILNSDDDYATWGSYKAALSDEVAGWMWHMQLGAIRTLMLDLATGKAHHTSSKRT